MASEGVGYLGVDVGAPEVERYFADLVALQEQGAESVLPHHQHRHRHNATGGGGRARH